MGSLLKGIDRVIYIDVDFLVLKDLEELWDIDMMGRIACACKDISIPYLDGETPLPVSDEEKHLPYFNSGLLLIDLKKWRETNVEKNSLELGFVTKPGLADQPILNYLFRGDVIFLDGAWNWQSPNVLLNGEVRIANYHFIWVKKPWLHYRTTLNYRIWRYYYKHLAHGNMGCLYQRIGIKRLGIAFREILIRASPILKRIYFASVAMKLGKDTPAFQGIAKYYIDSESMPSLEQEQAAFAHFVRSHKPIQ
jgi:lipopolysaccharide biosynthesis glycosyltransferase